MLKGRSHRVVVIGAAVAILAVATTGCRKHVTAHPAPPPPPPPARAEPGREGPSPPRIAGFQAEPSRIETGQTSTLRWTVSGDITDLRIEPGVGSITASGTRQVVPGSTTTYELLARGPGGEVRQTTSVTVLPAQPPPPPPAKIISGGTIEGSVTDPSGAPVAGASVTAIGNGPESRAVTTANGRFAFRDLQFGNYRFEITMPGFKRKVLDNVAVSSGQSMNLNPVIEVGELPSTVTVSGSGAPMPAPRERLVIRLADIAAPVSAGSGMGAAYNRLSVGAYRFELPDLRQQQKSVARLLVDADPIKVRTDAEWEKAVERPGNLPAQPTKISDLMTATLSASEGVAIHPLNQSPDGRETVFAGRLTRWSWEVTPSTTGTQVITLDLRAKIGPGFERVDPFPIVQQKTVTPSAETPGAQGGAKQAEQNTVADKKAPGSSGFPWLWLLGLLLVIAGVAGGILWRRRNVKAVALPVSGLPIPHLLVIYGMDQRQQAEKFCQKLGVSGCEYMYVLSGYPVGSPQWKEEFHRALAQADGVIVLLTGAALGEEWVNWQVEQAMRQQSGRGTPIYPVILDEKVSRAASTLGRLSSFAWLNGTIQQDVHELRERVAAIQPAPTRLVRCFISYSRKTQQEIDTAVRLEADLEQMGYQCFRDLTDLRGGEEWERTIRTQIADATHLLVLVTPSSAASRWVLKEILWAEGKKIIPLMTEGVVLPEELQRFQGIPLSNYDTALAELLRALQQYQPARKTGAA